MAAGWRQNAEAARGKERKKEGGDKKRAVCRYHPQKRRVDDVGQEAGCARANLTRAVFTPA